MGAPQLFAAGPTTGGTPVGGSGTPGTIPVWSSGTTLGNSLLVQDTATGPTVTLGANTSPYSSANRGLFSVNGSSSAMVGLTVGGVAAGYFGTAASSLQMIAGGSRTLQLGAANAIGMTFDAFNNVGIGTPSPGASLHVRGGGGTINSILDSSTSGDTRTELRNNGTRAGYIYWDASEVRAFADTGRFLSFYAGASERARIDSSGRLLVGTATSPSLGNAKLCVAGSGDNYIQWSDATANKGFVVGNQSGNNLTGYSYTGAIGSESFTQQFLFDVTNKCLNISAIGGANSINGLKLPATPGNADTQTLDCYQEATWTPTLAGFGGTNPTVTASYTRVGRLVTLTVRIAPTGGAQYSGTLLTTTLTVPTGMSPAANTGAASPFMDWNIADLGTVTVWNNGLIYLPTFALTTAETVFTVTYRV